MVHPGIETQVSDPIYIAEKVTNEIFLIARSLNEVREKIFMRTIRNRLGFTGRTCRPQRTYLNRSAHFSDPVLRSQHSRGFS